MEIAQYLKEHYYPKYDGIVPEMVPDNKTLLDALQAHHDKIIVVGDDEQIYGVAIYLTLSDESYEHIAEYDLSRIDVLSRLLQQKGDNFHFILLSAKGQIAIRAGIEIAKMRKPKTISWWNPSNTQVHRYKV